MDELLLEFIEQLRCQNTPISRKMQHLAQTMLWTSPTVMDMALKMLSWHQDLPSAHQNLTAWLQKFPCRSPKSIVVRCQDKKKELSQWLAAIPSSKTTPRTYVRSMIDHYRLCPMVLHWT